MPIDHNNDDTLMLTNSKMHFTTNPRGATLLLAACRQEGLTVSLLYTKDSNADHLYYDYGNTTYLITEVNFYNADGVQVHWHLGRLYPLRAEDMQHLEAWKTPKYTAIALEGTIKRVKSVGLTLDQPQIVSKGKNSSGQLQAALYIPWGHIEGINPRFVPYTETHYVCKVSERQLFRTNYFDCYVNFDTIYKSGGYPQRFDYDKLENRFMDILNQLRDADPYNDHEKVREQLRKLATDIHYY